MRVTHVIPYMHPDAGGPPVVVDRLCRRLAARGWDVEVITTNALAPPEDETWRSQFADAGYRMRVCKTTALGGFAYSRELKAALRESLAFSRLIHLHTLWTYPTYLAAALCHRQGVRYVVMPHGMIDPHSLQRKWLKKRLYGWLFEWPRLRRAAGMVYTNECERQLAESAVKRLPPAYIVPLAADEPPSENRAELAEDFLACRPTLRGQKLIVYLGRIHPKKGLDLLLPACAALMARRADVHLLMVGPGDEAYVNSLRELTRTLGIAERITWTGPLTGRSKWSVLAAASVFALPSYQENFGIVVAEAMRIGLAVVLSRRVNITEDVIRAGAGLACELDVGSVAASLGRFLDDPGLAAAAGQRGQELVRSTFSWERSARACERVYERILTSGSAPSRSPLADEVASEAVSS